MIPPLKSLTLDYSVRTREYTIRETNGDTRFGKVVVSPIAENLTLMSRLIEAMQITPTITYGLKYSKTADHNLNSREKSVLEGLIELHNTVVREKLY